ncbi:MAG: hypothetical protein A3I88_01145 [Candidatus Portnoybacteria bacterium RIFCSPLOWO2_12_FULL_39_9]|uniref:Uncharacterized protein n=1 Tax=Candidatus Portnoybacteria bacterium RIFCSPHIGHO2_12_FULL_38_9 TaxID=1801997 RepID=A0A1G2FHE5_9BACT|nr:MAG: hypothetical protein A3H00_01550 [Candidatus Portnoybacteria bacterium RBG_13_40_8]OGZ36591.1 MAG: hypothetical protein A2646_00205 [Candidatus Portnoybacteria bacterium RIFCSPHIGHO2_02_FULL_39_12]OGZ37485.1 MAG: hypothetical protein A3J64_00630 [Candidatus Portnoybacteria bacterium RIFCSPHIGHO2_12_FULL_38_9]OGZ39131.1 MAG: hypothetical protein A3F21_00205 [Candidatus Portnoybacteria bacterium RIFCSPLOWO2_01_FULL_38_39]OGZ39825.1 MAG: hypothetical protein A3I88_01145 [Candidatus Portnoy
MIQIVYGNHFLKSAKKLPKKQQIKLAKLLEIFKENPFHRLLQTKSLTGPLAGFYSFRITRDWRVIFEFINPQTIKLIEAAHRKDIYR